MNIQEKLFALQDTAYLDFNAKLVPTVSKETMIGVRTPAIRNLAKEVAVEPEVASSFMKDLPHRYFDENNLHGSLISRMRDVDACLQALNDFLPYVDNWATCDMMSPKVLKKDLNKLLVQIKKWLVSDHEYTVRFGLNMLMSFYLDTAFKPEYLEMAASVEMGEYYVDMMVAWFFQVALVKQYEAALPYLERNLLPQWVHNKTIQKAVESYRMTPEQKAYLKTLRRK